MENRLRGTEGLYIALEMERRGIHLYRRARNIAGEKRLAALLAALEAEEQQHHATFLSMLAALGEARLPDEECALIAAKAADFFFPGGLMQIEMEGALASPEALIGEAMRQERDAIAFYARLAGHLDEAGRETVQGIIREEEGHLRSLHLKNLEYGKGGFGS